MKIEGKVQSGFGHFERRIGQYMDLFLAATGESALFPGTINVNIGCELPVHEDFRMDDPWVSENQELIFERCTINSTPAYRIRPWNRETGLGGHGDHILEIICSTKLDNVEPGTKVVLDFFRVTAGQVPRICTY